MVVVEAVEDFYVDIRLEMLCERSEEVLEVFHREIFDFGAHRVEFYERVAAPSEIDDSACEGVIHRDVGEPEPSDATPLLKGLRVGLANCDTDILDQVVFEVSLRLYREVKGAVFAEDDEHMVKEGDSCSTLKQPLAL